MMVHLREFNYEDRISYLGLTTLETRNLRGDLIHAFKIIKVYDSNELNNSFKLAINNLSGHFLSNFLSLDVI